MTSLTPTARAAYGTFSSQRETSTRATREAILRAAQELFSKDGYASTGIAKIAAAAGVTRQTFYLHFPSKLAVLQRLITNFERGILTLYEELAALQWPGRQELADWVEKFLTFCEADRKTVLLLLAMMPVEGDLAQDRADLYQRLLAILGSGHAAFARAASGDNVAARGMAVMLLAQIEALPRLAFTAVPLCDRQSLIDAVAEDLLRFIGEAPLNDAPHPTI